MLKAAHSKFKTSILILNSSTFKIQSININFNSKKVRAKAVVDALLAASKNPQLAPPKPLCSFLLRISSDGVYYPGARDVNGVMQPKFLWPEEEQVKRFCGGAPLQPALCNPFPLRFS